MTFRFLFIILVFVTCAGWVYPLDAQPFTPPFSQDAVLSYLEKIISLQQNAANLPVSTDGAREAILADTLKQNTATVSQNGFDFARSQASLLDKSNVPAEAVPGDAPNPSDLEKYATTINQHVTDLQKALAIVNSRIRRTPVSQRRALLIQQQTLTGELNLAKAQAELIGSIGESVKNTGETDTSSGLLKKIDNLNRSVATLAPVTVKSAADTKAEPVKPAADDTAKDRRGGLLRLGSDLFALWQKQAQLRSLKENVGDLRDSTKEMRAQLRTTLQTMAKSGNSLAQDGAAKTLAEQRQDFDTLVNNFKLLSASVVPLSQTNAALDNTKLTLRDWQDLTDDMLKTTARQFLWHLALLGVAIMIPLALSEAARRATTHYVKDVRRQRQLRFLRRVLFTLIIVLIIALNLASEFGSLATFAGFLTAGIAVALQNILLSLVAHFFFFGRYGVRAGDRVTVGGVTGDVTQVGMVRLYLMEVEGSGDETRPTGRIVAFPNSILFQPTAFFKHMTAV